MKPSMIFYYIHKARFDIRNNENWIFPAGTPKRTIGILPIIMVLLFAPILSCSTQVETIYEKLNTPLGLKVEIHPDGDGHLITFYADNRGKQSFLGYALFEGTSIEESQTRYKTAESTVILSVDTNRDVDSPYQFKLGGTDSTASGVPHSTSELTAGNYLSIRAMPDYPEDRLDNLDPKKGPVPSHPSNAFLIP